MQNTTKYFILSATKKRVDTLATIKIMMNYQKCSKNLAHDNTLFHLIMLSLTYPIVVYVNKCYLGARNTHGAQYFSIADQKITLSSRNSACVTCYIMNL